MEDDNLKLLKDELTAQLDSYSYNETTMDIFKHVTGNDDLDDCDPVKPNSKLKNILSAKNDWEFCVDALEHQAFIILDKDLKVIRTNRTLERWGWADVTKIRGTHILNLITPAIQHASSNDWIDEWCQLDTQSNAEWISENYKTGQTYHFSYFPNRDIDSSHHNENCYAVMLVTDITEQNNLSSKNKSPENKNSEETDLIRLSAYRLHQLANKLIQSQEDERKRVSSELHDGLGQILSALKYKVEFAKLEVEANSNAVETKTVLNDILANVMDALGELRRVSTDLRPSVLEDLGIILTLRWFAEEYNKIYTQLNIEFDIDVKEVDIPDENKHIIYRIVQESMNNIAKHSDATNIYVSLTKFEAGIMLRIKDDGSGFDLNKIKQAEKSGLGLKTMEERAVSSGAQFTMKSTALSGTVVQVLWPS